MEISKVSIKNFRGVKSAEFPLSNLSCIIGENNAGKSSILLAIDLFFSGSSINESDFYDREEEIKIEMEFKGIEEGDLKRVKEHHKERIEEIIDKDAGSITLVRIYNPSKETSLNCRKMLPKNKKLRKEEYDEYLKGKTSEKKLSETLNNELPNYIDQFKDFSSQKIVKSKIEEIKTKLPDSEFNKEISALPSGIPQSINKLMPIPIFIEAVKDFSDEVKTRESATFGKLLGILTKYLEEDKGLEKIKESFDELAKLLNIQRTEIGQPSDNRLKKVKDIESHVQKNIQENFPKASIELQVEKPELRQILSNAKIWVDDGGNKDQIEYKGDGLKRSFTFSLLKSYIEIKKKRDEEEKESEEEILDPKEMIKEQPYLFLFEEPELYLHPSGQKILFNALENLTKEENQVITTTHSPLFFSPVSTGLFLKLQKEFPEIDKPYGKIMPVDVSENLTNKEAFQIICYENNAAAFFSSKVLLVEGDADYIFLKSVAKKIDDDWDFEAKNIPIVKINGKGNIKKFRDFFEEFGVSTFCLLDLDFILDEFEKLNLNKEINEKREQIIYKVNQKAKENNITPKMNTKRVKQAIRTNTWADKYQRLKELANKVKQGHEITDNEKEEIDSLFEKETYLVQREVLENHASEVDGLQSLLQELRENKVFILSKGEIEDYYPEETEGQDKPSKALDAINRINGKEDLKNSCPEVEHRGDSMLELEAIFEEIFEE